MFTLDQLVHCFSLSVSHYPGIVCYLAFKVDKLILFHSSRSGQKYTLCGKQRNPKPMLICNVHVRWEEIMEKMEDGGKVKHTHAYISIGYPSTFMFTLANPVWEGRFFFCINVQFCSQSSFRCY
ncbi:UNVERIFIED_CONTAM: hypothetical protein K2H54_015384 [Gekko kuhli]